MALDLTVRGLLDELRTAELKVDPYLQSWEDDIGRLTGPGYRSGHGESEPENHVYELCTLTLGDLVTGNPQVRFASARGQGPAQERAKALTFAANHWTRETNMRALNEKLAMDYEVRWAICLVTSEPRPGLSEAEDPPYWPQAKRISPRRFLFDPAALDPESWRWSGHLNIRDKEDLIRDALENPDSGWIVENLEALAGTPLDKYRDEDVDIVDRNEIGYWEIWVGGNDYPEYTGEPGFNGRLFTIVEGQSEGGPAGDGWVRLPRPAFGPRDGPYEFLGATIVPDDAVPLSRSVATKQQAEYLNRIDRSIIRSVEDYKRLILTRDPKLAETIKDGRHDYVYMLNEEDPRKNTVSMEIAGLTEQHMVAKEDARQTLDRASGISDAQRGNVTGNATATENAIAGQAGTKRSAFHAGKFKDFIARILKKVAWYFDTDEDVVYQLGPESVGQFPDPETGLPNLVPPTVSGQAQGAGDLTDLDLTIEVGSMERTDETARQIQSAQLDAKIQFISAVAPTAPYIDWAGYVELQADLSDIPALARIVDPNLLAMWTAMQMQMMQPMPPAQGSPTEGQPRKATDAPGVGRSTPRPTLPRRQAGTAQPPTSMQAAGANAPKPVGAAGP